MWTCWKALFLTLSNVMINCNCFNEWDYSLLVPNEVSEPYLTLWIDCYLSIRNHMTKSIYVAVIRMIMLPLCPYFIFIDTSISKHVDIFFYFGFRLRTSEVYAWGSWYIHFASCFYVNIYCIMGCYHTLYLITYGYSLLFYKVYHEEGECRQLGFWLEKEQILETYST